MMMIINTNVEKLLVLIGLFASNLAKDCQCGERNNQRQEIDLKVIRAEEAEPNEFPWAALLRIQNTSQVGRGHARCGGTLINDR